MPGGRPRKFTEVEKMQARIDLYFDDCEARGKPPTIAGLAYSLGFEDRHALAEYEKRDEFSATVKKARLRIEQDRAERVLDKDRFTAGVIFDLKANHGWKDTVHVDNTSSDGSMTPRGDVEETRAAIKSKLAGVTASRGSGSVS